MSRKFVWVVPLLLALSSASDAKPKDKPKAAPEFDPSASGAALALLVGGAWVLSVRLRRGPERD